MKFLNKQAITKIQATIIVAIIVVVAAVGVYYATLPPAPPPPPPVKEWVSLAEAAEPYKDTTIRILTWSDSWNERVKKELVPEFKEITGITVIYDTVGWEVVSEKQVAELSAATGAYDVMSWGQILQPEYILSGWMANLEEIWEEHPELVDPEFDFEDFGPLTIEMLKMPPAVGTYGLPIFVYSRYLAYRADLFEEAELEPPTTFESFLAAIKEFSKPKWRERGIYPYTTPMARGYEIVEEWWSWLHAFGGDYVEDPLARENMPYIDTPAGRESLHFIKTLLDKEYAYPGLLAASYWDATVPYLEGKAAMLNNWVELGILEVYGEPAYAHILENTRYILVPPRGADGRYGSELFVSAYGIPSASTKKEAAWLFIQFVLSKENMRRLAAFGSPVRVSVATDPEILEMLVYMPVSIENYKKCSAIYPRFFGFDPYTEILAREFHLALIGEKTIEDATDTAQKEVCDLFLEYEVITEEEHKAAYEGWADVEPRLGRLPDGYMAWKEVI